MRRAFYRLRQKSSVEETASDSKLHCQCAVTTTGFADGLTGTSLIRDPCTAPHAVERESRLLANQPGVSLTLLEASALVTGILLGYDMGHWMIIAFDTKKLRETCEDNAVAVKVLGPAAAEALQQRLADLRAAGNISDVIVGNPRVSGADGATLTINLTESVHTIWSANHVSQPRDQSGQIDWSRTRRVRLLEIVSD